MILRGLGAAMVQAKEPSLPRSRLATPVWYACLLRRPEAWVSKNKPRVHCLLDVARGWLGVWAAQCQETYTGGARVTRAGDEGPIFVRALSRQPSAAHRPTPREHGAPQDIIFTVYLARSHSLQPSECCSAVVLTACGQRASKCSSSATGSGSANWRRSKWRDLLFFDPWNGSNTRFTIISTFNTCAVLVLGSMTVLGASPTLLLLSRFHASLACVHLCLSFLV